MILLIFNHGLKVNSSLQHSFLCNFLIIFPQDMRNLKHIYDNHVNSDMSFEIFQQLCSKCWIEKYGFLVIDKESLKNEGRYRKTFNYYVKFD